MRLPGGLWPLLFIEVDLLVLVTANRDPNLCRCLAQLCLLVGEESFLGAGRALCPVQPLEATAQAGVPQRAIAAAVAGQLVNNAADPDYLLVNVHLPWVTEVFPGKLGS